MTPMVSHPTPPQHTHFIAVEVSPDTAPTPTTSHTSVTHSMMNVRRLVAASSCFVVTFRSEVKLVKACEWWSQG